MLLKIGIGYIFKEDSQQNHQAYVLSLLFILYNETCDLILAVTLSVMCFYFVIFNLSFLNKVSCWRMYASCVWVCLCLYMAGCKYIWLSLLVPKGVQEKRTEVLENKVDRMWVSNAFFLMNTCEVIHQWREKAVLLFVLEKFDFQCDLWQDVEYYTLQQAHITVLLIMQLTAKTHLI